jgi:lipopolysaccharide transport system ATP-binding protein
VQVAHDAETQPGDDGRSEGDATGAEGPTGSDQPGDDATGNSTDDAEVAITVDHVSKKFRLYRDRASSLKEMVTRRFTSRYEEFWAVNDVDIRIKRGQTFGLIGHNGSGKSTLLRLMAGIHPPTSGTITSHGRISALLELGAGFHPDLTGRENIYLNGSILGLSRKEVDQVIDRIISFAGLEAFIDSPVKVYSSGMYVRLGFAVAVHVEPEILFIDEVIAVGDEEFQRRCFDHLYKLRRQGVTIVLVSHAHSLMQTMCDEVAWLDHGRLVEIGDPNTVVKHYIEAVNVTEGERLDAEAGLAGESADGSAGRSATRRQSSEAAVQIVQVDVLGPDGRPTRVAGSGDAMTIRLHFDATEPVDDPTFSVGIDHESGQNLVGTNTVFHQAATGRIEGRGHIDFVVPRLPLLPGTYLVDVAVTDKSMMHTFDHRLEEVTFHVQPGSSPERSGLIDLGGHWEGPVLRGSLGPSELAREA